MLNILLLITVSNGCHLKINKLFLFYLFVNKIKINLFNGLYKKKYFVWNTNPALYSFLNRLLLITVSSGYHLKINIWFLF